ncbi:MAG: hypothetical protein AB1782_04095 [Cyanobacteriota bacterium]
MNLTNVQHMTKQDRIERCIQRLENMLLVESVEKAVLDNEADAILGEMCTLVEYEPEMVDFFNNQMQQIILDIVDLSIIRSEVVKKIRLLEGLNSQAKVKAGHIIERFNYVEARVRSSLIAKRIKKENNE